MNSVAAIWSCPRPSSASRTTPTCTNTSIPAGATPPTWDHRRIVSKLWNRCAGASCSPARVTFSTFVSHWMPPPQSVGSLVEMSRLPPELDGLYLEFLNRAVKLGNKKWPADYAPLMGALAVAEEGLTVRQLQNFTRRPESAVMGPRSST